MIPHDVRHDTMEKCVNSTEMEALIPLLTSLSYEFGEREKV